MTIGSGDRSAEDHARHGDPLHRKVAGLIRRIIVEFSWTGPASRPVLGIWQLRGFRELAEVVKAEVFQGIGIWARPPRGVASDPSRVEAIAVSVGDSDHQVVIAMRDEKTRQAIAGKVGENETLLHNTLAGVHVKADGTVHVSTHGGAAERLPTWADFTALRDWVRAQFSELDGHVHEVVGAATTAIVSVSTAATPPTADAPEPTGTTVLKGE